MYGTNKLLTHSEKSKMTRNEIQDALETFLYASPERQLKIYEMLFAAFDALTAEREHDGHEPSDAALSSLSRKELEDHARVLEHEIVQTHRLAIEAERRLEHTEQIYKAQIEATTEQRRRAAEAESRHALVQVGFERIAEEKEQLRDKLAEAESARDELAANALEQAASRNKLELRVFELERARDAAIAEANQYRTDLKAEWDGNASLREQFGAQPRETFMDFIARLYCECEEARAQLETEVRQHDETKKASLVRIGKLLTEPDHLKSKNYTDKELETERTRIVVYLRKLEQEHLDRADACLNEDEKWVHRSRAVGVEFAADDIESKKDDKK